MVAILYWPQYVNNNNKNIDNILAADSIVDALFELCLFCTGEATHSGR